MIVYSSIKVEKSRKLKFIQISFQLHDVEMYRIPRQTCNSSLILLTFRSSMCLKQKLKRMFETEKTLKPAALTVFLPT